MAGVSSVGLKNFRVGNARHVFDFVLDLCFNETIIACCSIPHIYSAYPLIMKHLFTHLMLYTTTALCFSGCAQDINHANTNVSKSSSATAPHSMSQFPVQVPFDAAKANQTASVDFWVSPPPNYGLVDSELRPNWVFYINLSSPYSEQSDALSTVEKFTQQKQPLYQLKIYRIDTDKPELQQLFFATLDDNQFKPAYSNIFSPTPMSWGAEERDYTLAYFKLPRTQIGHYRAEVISTVDTPELKPFPFKFSVDLGPRR